MNWILDVLEYLLTALIIKPPIEDYMIPKIERTVKQVYERTYSDEDFAGLNLDCYSPLKVASAICRLDLRKRLMKILLIDIAPIR